MQKSKKSSEETDLIRTRKLHIYFELSHTIQHFFLAVYNELHAKHQCSVFDLLIQKIWYFLLHECFVRLHWTVHVSFFEKVQVILMSVCLYPDKKI